MFIYCHHFASPLLWRAKVNELQSGLTSPHKVCFESYIFIIFALSSMNTLNHGTNSISPWVKPGRQLYHAPRKLRQAQLADVLINLKVNKLKKKVFINKNMLLCFLRVFKAGIN